MEIRVASPADAPALLELIRAFQRHLGARDPGPTALAEVLPTVLADPATEFALARAPDGAPLGYAQIRIFRSLWAAGVEAHLEDLFVMSGARGAGVGRALLDFALGRASARGARFVGLHTNERNEGARAFYRRAGFREKREARWPDGREIHWGLEIAPAAATAPEAGGDAAHGHASAASGQAAWMFREFAPVGVDLDSHASVERYDARQGTSAEADDALLDDLGVGPGTVLVDLGTGTGSLPVRAALRGAEAHGVDVSRTMLAFADRRARQAGVRVHLHHAGFLTYAHRGAPAQVVTTRAALHQLPDTWKQVALVRMAGLLAPGGRLHLRDVMWSFAASETEARLPEWIDAVARPAGEGFTRADFETHLREEFSTFAWILEGMVERAGLAIESVRCPAPWTGEIRARKPRGVGRGRARSEVGAARTQR